MGGTVTGPRMSFVGLGESDPRVNSSPLQPGTSEPADWELRTLGDIGQSLIGLTYDPSDVSADGVLVLRSSNIRDGVLVFDDNVFVDMDIPARIHVQDGDLLVCVRNGSRALIGKSALIGEEALAMTFGAFMAVFRSEHNKFVSYCFQSEIIKRQIQEHLGATINQITNKSMAGFRIPFPPPEERAAITAALSDIDNLIAALNALIAKKRAIKQAAMQQLLTGKTRLPGFEGEWETKRIGAFTDCTAGGTPNTEIPAYWNGSIRWMSSGELHVKRVYEVAGRITEAGLRNSSTKMIPPQCVLIGLAGQGKTRGTVAVNMVPLCTNQSIAAIFPNLSFDTGYLFYNLENRYEELRELSTGDGGRGGLNLSIIRAIEVPFPSKSEQQAIGQVLSDMDAEIEALEARVAKTRDIKQGMMQQLLTGRVRLPVPTTAPEDSPL